MAFPLHFLRSYAYVALAISSVLVAAPLHSPSRAMVRRVAGAMGWRGLHTALPADAATEVLAYQAPVRLDNRTQHPDNITFYELFVVCQLVADRQPRSVFEFGTFDGRTTLHLAMNSPAATRITTIDLPERESPFEDPTLVGRRFGGTPYAERITQLRENTRRFDPAPYAGRMDFIFIDAGHTYEDVCNDTDLALRLAAPDDCLILWHDYTQWPGVQQALDERYQVGGRYAGLRQIAGTSMAMLDLRAQPGENDRARSPRSSRAQSAAPGIRTRA